MSIQNKIFQNILKIFSNYSQIILKLFPSYYFQVNLIINEKNSKVKVQFMNLKKISNSIQQIVRNQTKVTINIKLL